MINKEELEVLNKKLDLLDEEAFYYVWNDKERDIVRKLIEENKRLTELEEEHQKLNGELQKKLTYYENICKGKSIQELGMSDLYKED